MKQNQGSTFGCRVSLAVAAVGGELGFGPGLGCGSDKSSDSHPLKGHFCLVWLDLACAMTAMTTVGRLLSLGLIMWPQRAMKLWFRGFSVSTFHL